MNLLLDFLAIFKNLRPDRNELIVLDFVCYFHEFDSTKERTS